MRNLLCILILLLSACKDEHANQIIYDVDCEDCNVAYKDAKGVVQAVENITIGWMYSFQGNPGTSVSVSAQSNKPSGKVYVKIRWDGEVLDENAATGAYVVVSASANIPD